MQRGSRGRGGGPRDRRSTRGPGDAPLTGGGRGRGIFNGRGHTVARRWGMGAAGWGASCVHYNNTAPNLDITTATSDGRGNPASQTFTQSGEGGCADHGRQWRGWGTPPPFAGDEPGGAGRRAMGEHRRRAMGAADGQRRGGGAAPRGCDAAPGIETRGCTGGGAGGSRRGAARKQEETLR